MTNTDTHPPQSKSRVGLVASIIGIICAVVILAYLVNIFNSDQSSETTSSVVTDVEETSEPETAEVPKVVEEPQVADKPEVAEAPEVEEVLEVEEVPEVEEVVEINESLETPEIEVASLSDLDIVRVEPDGSTIIAGRAEPNARITIISGGKILAETMADELGDFVVLLDEPLPPGSHELSILVNGVLSDETIGVFVPERESGEQPLVIVSPLDDATEILQFPDSSEQDQVDSAEPEETIITEETVDLLEYELSIRAVEAEDGKVYVAGEATTGKIVNVYIENGLIGDEKPDSNGRWLLEADMQLRPGTHTVRADLIDGTNGEVLRQVAVDFQKEEGQEIALPVVSQGDNTDSEDFSTLELTVSGPSAIIIKRGDNLWNISRKLYGHGIRYTTIYEANRDQIVDPDLIYPEQKFITPELDELTNQ